MHTPLVLTHRPTIKPLVIAVLAAASLNFTQRSYAADANGNGSLQLCKPGFANGHRDGWAAGYQGNGSFNCGDDHVSFALINNGANAGAGGYTDGTARISGMENGQLELLGKSGISLLGRTRFNANVDMGAQNINNLADGTQDGDAVNFAQLKASALSAANALGLTDIKADGTLAVPEYMIQNSNRSGVRAAFEALDQAVTANGNQITSHDQALDEHGGKIQQLTDRLNELSDGSLGLVKQASSDAPITIGASTGGDVVDVSGSGGSRRVSGVANGQQDNDAVNFGQLSQVGVVDGSRLLAAVVYDDAGLSRISLGGSHGTVIDHLSNGLLASGSKEAVNGGQLFEIQLDLQIKFDDLKDRYGELKDRVDQVEQDIADTDAPIDSSFPGTGDNSTAIGDGASASGDNSTAIGHDTIASGNNGTAIGAGAIASGQDSTAVGGNANASGDGSTAIGANAQAGGNNSTAIGANSQAQANNSVALGNGSIADRDNSVSIGSEGHERQLTHVARGTAPTDAVNLSQLREAQDWARGYADRKIERMGRIAHAGAAGAMAMANLPQPYQPGQRGIGAGLGSFRGQSALSVGGGAITSGGRWVLRGSLVTTTEGGLGAGAGALVVW